MIYCTLILSMPIDPQNLFFGISFETTRQINGFGQFFNFFPFDNSEFTGAKSLQRPTQTGKRKPGILDCGHFILFLYAHKTVQPPFMWETSPCLLSKYNPESLAKWINSKHFKDVQ